MINVNQMTAEFAKMPDEALRQYATMHKNDPYTVALVMSESNRRKQMRTSAQGQQEQPPTVVDQQLAQMGAPSAADTGIGTLPQQPMQMAEGGIVSSPTLALIGEAGPEAVVPLDRLGTGGGITINVTGGLATSAEIGQSVVNALRAYSRSAGPLALNIA